MTGVQTCALPISYEETTNGFIFPNTKAWGKLDSAEVIKDLNKTYKIGRASCRERV